jgi:hypothetical protein
MKQSIRKRNMDIKHWVAEQQRKNPQWRHSALVEAASERFYLAERTIRAVLNNEGSYA